MESCSTTAESVSCSNAQRKEGRVTKLLRVVLALGAALAMCAAPRARAAEPTKLISLDAQEADIPRILAILAEKAGLNLVTGPGVSSGRISVRLRDVPVDQAVNLVVRAAGLAYERIGNSILVADAKSLKDETGLSTYLVDLKFANAEEVRDAIKSLAPDVQIDRGGNRLIIVTSPRVIAEVQMVVNAMDVPLQQVMLEARIVGTGTACAAGGAAPVQTVQKEEVGIKLRITPLINADGFITTTISPEVSSVIAFRGPNNDLPEVSTRQATTTVRLKDGNAVI